MCVGNALLIHDMCTTLKVFFTRGVYGERVGEISRVECGCGLGLSTFCGGFKLGGYFW